MKYKTYSKIFLLIIFIWSAFLSLPSFSLESTDIILNNIISKNENTFGELTLNLTDKAQYSLNKDSDEMILSVDLLGVKYFKKEDIKIFNNRLIKLWRVSQVKQSPPVVNLTIIFKKPVRYSLDNIPNGLLISYQERVPILSSSISKQKKDKNTNISQKVLFKFSNSTLSEVVDALSKKFGLTSVIEKDGDLKINAVTKADTIDECLKEVLQQNKIDFIKKGNLLIVKGRKEIPLFDKKVSFNFNDMNLRDTFQTISKITHLNIVVDNTVKERNVNLFINDMKLKDVMDLILTTYQLDGHKFNDNTFIVTEKYEGKKFVKDKIRRVFQLINAKPADVVDLLKANHELSSRLALDSITVDERINALIVYDTPENVKILTDIIKGIDKKLKQVRIDVKLVEINKNDLDQFGVNIDNLPISFAIKDIGHIKKTSGDIITTLQMLTQKKHAKILSSPIIRVVDGKEATINVGETIPVPYYTYDGISINNGGYNNTTYDPQGRPINNSNYNNSNINVTGDQLRYVQPLKQYRDIDVGIKLTVKPKIHEDNEIALDVNLNVSSVISISEDGQVHKATKDTETYVRVKDGETVVLGGLINHREDKQVGSHPILNRIPIIKKIFKRNNDTIQNSEMVMFLTPYLVNEDGKKEPLIDEYENLAYKPDNE